MENNENRKKIEKISITGKFLGQIVINRIKEIGLIKCLGIDDSSVMKSEVCGAVAEIITGALNSRRFPINNHSFNISISKSSKFQSIRNLIGII